MNILIVGGGPAGMTLANFLESGKHRITLIEKEKKFVTMGYGLFFLNEGKEIVRKLIHRRDLRAISRDLAVGYYVSSTGDRLLKHHYNQKFHVKENASITGVGRKKLHHLLLQHLSKNVIVKMGTTITEISNTQKSARVTFSDGTHGTYDLVIAADGFHSTLRDRFFRSTTAVLPWIARYFWLPTALRHFTMECGSSSIVMCLPLRGRSVGLALEYQSQHDTTKNAGANMRALQKFYRSIGIGPKKMQECYRHSYCSSMRYLYTDGWYRKRVILIGDAQHAMTPTMGYGTTLALEDAYHLSRAINGLPAHASFHALQKSLAGFSADRTPRVQRLRFMNQVIEFFALRHSEIYYRLIYHFKKIIPNCVISTLDWLSRMFLRYA